MFPMLNPITNTEYEVFGPNDNLSSTFRSLTKDMSSFGALAKRLFEECEIPAIQTDKAFLPYDYVIERQKKSDDETEVTHVFRIACAGFSKENIEVSKKANLLTIEFKNNKSEESNELVEGLTKSVVHNGLTSKSGKISWAHKCLGEATIEKCKIEDGILTIRIKENPPKDDSTKIQID